MACVFLKYITKFYLLIVQLRMFCLLILLNEQNKKNKNTFYSREIFFMSFPWMDFVSIVLITNIAIFRVLYENLSCWPLKWCIVNSQNIEFSIRSIHMVYLMWSMSRTFYYVVRQFCKNVSKRILNTLLYVYGLLKNDSIFCNYQNIMT